MNLPKSANRGKFFTEKNLQTLATYDIETLYRSLFLGKEGGTAMWTIDQYCSLEGEKAYSLGLMTKHMADIMYSQFKDSGKLYRLDLKPIENIKEQDNSCFPFLPRKNSRLAEFLAGRLRDYLLCSGDENSKPN